MNKTSIEWTDYTWNPIHARADVGSRAGKTGNFCTRISPGCLNCYASKINQRWGNGLEYIVPNLQNVDFYLDEKELPKPLKLKTPSNIFVGDMFDLFHENIPEGFIAQVLTQAYACQQHTFQFLTKRAERMCYMFRAMFGDQPRAHIHAGVSVEDQPRADERIPLLLQTPATVRFLSVEPMLEAIDLERYLYDDGQRQEVDWVICGGESGPGARPFNLAWAESLLEQCKAAGVPFFMKQMGTRPQVHSCRDESCTHPDCGMESVRMKDSKGGDPAEWPEHLRVRQFPSGKLVTA